MKNTKDLLFVTNKMKLSTFIENMTEEAIKKLELYKQEDPDLKEAIEDENAVFILKDIDVGIRDDIEFDEGERSEISYITTLAIDRDNEIVMPKGMIDKFYKNKNPIVLLGHDYHGTNTGGVHLGRNVWMKQKPKGILAKTVYQDTPEAEKVFQSHKNGFPLMKSIGFIPTDTVFNPAVDRCFPCNREETPDKEKNDKEFEKTYGLWKEQFESAFGTKAPEKQPDAIYRKWIILEYSEVLIGSNPEALSVAVAKNISLEESTNILLEEATNIVVGETKDITVTREQIKGLLKYYGNGYLIKNKLSDLGEEKDIEKSVIPFKDFGIVADMGTEWDAGKEVRASDTDDLLKMSTWYDKENPDVKGSYKLPHHRQSDKKSIWRGVTGAMAALLGARGGVSVPDADRKGIYNHLAKHYKQFDREAPEFKDLEEKELVIKVTADTFDILDNIDYIKEGRVLSTKNRKLIKDSIESMSKSITALQDLMEATEQTSNDGKNIDDNLDNQETEVTGENLTTFLTESLGLDKADPDKKTLDQIKKDKELQVKGIFQV